MSVSESETDKSLALLVSEAGVVHNTLVLASKVYSITLLCPVYGVDVLKLTVGIIHRWFGDCQGSPFVWRERQG